MTSYRTVKRPYAIAIYKKSPSRKKEYLFKTILVNKAETQKGKVRFADIPATSIY